MPHSQRYFHLHLISDSTGETLIAASRAVTSQYGTTHAIEHVHPMVRSRQKLDEIITELDSKPGIVLFTIANEALAQELSEQCKQMGIPCVSILEPIFQAFQSGAIDAAEWVGPMLDQAFGLQKVAKHCYVPAFHEPSAGLEIVVNKEAWDGLPKHLQAVIANAADAANTEALAQFAYFNALAMKQLQDAGVEFGSFPDDVVAALKKASMEVLEENAAANPTFRKVMDSYNAFLDIARPYAATVEAPVYSQRM